MKKKLLFFTILAMCLFTLSACGNSKFDLANYLIEERNNLFTAEDELYNVSLSSGLRESDYNFDGVVSEKVDFAVLTLMRNDSCPLSNDNYTYIVTINEETFTGMLEKSPVDNSYAVDLEINVPDDAAINVSISFTGYTFNQDLVNTSNIFTVDKQAALEIANKELKEEVKNLTADNSKVEVVMKILKDYSTADVKNYYWYVGAISTNGETSGVLIDANTGEVIAKKI